MAVNAEIFTEHDGWGGPLSWSLGLHVAVLGVIVGSSVLLGNWRGSPWGGSGGGGDALNVSIVSSIPLPRTEGTNVVAVESKGVSTTQPKAEERSPDAIPIPAREAKRKPWEKAPRTVTPPKEKPVETASNVVPFGQGGPLSGPYSVFNSAGAKGGFGFTGSGGDFGSRYSWYVDIVRRKVSENWLKYEIDPNIHDARRVYIEFEIQRDGRPTKIQVEQSSGVPSLDQSAVRALQRIDTFGPLPQDYSGSRVSVEFWFDYRR